MTQIILNDGIYLPEVSRDGYSCAEEPLVVQLEMISGRTVLEERGRVWSVSYEYDYMGNDLMRRALEVLRSGAPFFAAVLPDNGDQLIRSSFVVTSLEQPKMAFSRKEKAYWHRLAFTLREEEPHG